MSQEEMIEQLENTILLIEQNGKDWWDERDIPILKEAIKAMKTEPCEDAVDRQKLIDLATSWDKHFSDSDRCVSLADIKALPPVQPEQKMGKWILHKSFDNGHKNCNECIECSQCHTWFGHDCYAKTPYCPNCGAKMEEGE